MRTGAASAFAAITGYSVGIAINSHESSLLAFGLLVSGVSFILGFVIQGDF